MDYIKTNWVDRDVEYPNRYEDGESNQITLTPSPGTIYAPGTAIVSATMNKIETGIDDAAVAIDNTVISHTFGVMW